MTVLCILCVIFNFIVSTTTSNFSPTPPPPLVLSNGVEMPRIGFTTWSGFSSKLTSITNIKSANPDLDKTLHYAIEHTGYRFIDASACEGLNERLVGSVVTALLKDHFVSRNDLFISTKLSNYNHKKHQVVPELQESLERLNLKYVDLYLMHMPFALFLNNMVDDSVDYMETWQGMIDALRLNLTRSVGVAHFTVDMLERLVRSEVKPHVLQIEVNLNLQQPELLQYCEDNSIAVLGAHALGSLYATERHLDAAPLPRLDDPLLAGLANKYEKTVPQIALRFLVDRNVVPLITTDSQYRLQESFGIFDFELDAYEIFLLKSFHTGFRTLDFKYWSHALFYPFKGDYATEIRQNMYPEYYKMIYKGPGINVSAVTEQPPLNDV